MVLLFINFLAVHMDQLMGRAKQKERERKGRLLFARVWTISFRQREVRMRTDQILLAASLEPRQPFYITRFSYIAIAIARYVATCYYCIEQLY